MESLHVNAILLIFCFFFFVLLQLVSSHDINVTHNSSGAGCIDNERRALAEFKGSFVDDANRLSSWTGKDCCNWVGITCNNLTGRIVKVDLRNPIQFYYDDYFGFDNYDDYNKHCLIGEVNPSICDLEHLIHLDLSSNDFSGTQIPNCFGSLRNLRYLNLSVAGFQGEIPPYLGNLSQLQHLDLGRCSDHVCFDPFLSVIKSLEWITGFSILKSLDLSGNNLSECVDWLESVNKLPTLSSLNLWWCHLPYAKLTFALLPSHFNLTSLVSLDIGDNGLNSITLLNWFSNLTTNLQVLRLDGNNMNDPFPFMLQKLTSLTILDISSNSLTNSSFLLDLLCDLTSLISVDLSFNNELEGSLPICLGNLTSLKVFDLRCNKFGGNIPIELCRLKQLTDLDLSYNSFNSSIPSCLGQLSNLKHLGISGNGEISDSHFMELQNLKVLIINSNQLLTLNVSPQWIPPFQLNVLRMYSLHIGPQFPTWLQTQKNVSFLRMANVGITAAIPEWFWITFSNIQLLDLSRNNIHGVLPSSMKNMKSLIYMDLSNNRLNGTIPEWIGEELSQLEEVRLQSNNVSGNVPTQFCQLPKLETRKLSKNNLTGHIPDCLF